MQPVDNNTPPGSQNSQFLYGRADLSRECEVCRRFLWTRQDNPKFVDDVGPAHLSELWTCVARSNDCHFIGIEKLGNLSNAVADDVLKKLPGKLPNPMLLIANHSVHVAVIFQPVGEHAFNVNRWASENAPSKKLPHANHLGTELVVVPRGDFEPVLLRHR